jgi:hypothetical protein
MAAAPALASARRYTGCGWGVVVVVGGVEEAVACRYFCDRCDHGINAAVGSACACEGASRRRAQGQGLRCTV